MSAKKSSKKEALLNNEELERAKKLVLEQKERQERAQKCIKAIEKVMEEFNCEVVISQPQFTIVAK